MQELIQDIFIVSIPVLFISVFGTGLVRKIALSRKILDLPTKRSSHLKATPTGGGIAIVAAFYAGLAVLVYGNKFDLLDIQVLSMGFVLAITGFVDDLKHLDFRWRIAVHLCAGLIVALILGDIPDIQQDGLQFNMGLLTVPITVLTLIWATNLYNFMDGTDGLAGSECCFIVLAAAGLLVLDGNTMLSLVCLVLFSACAGFLVWNWAPAKIFMGDTGSGFLGFILASIAFLSIYSGSMSLWTWLLLPGVFIADATLTVVKRIYSGERWYQAHCTHGYQHMARLFGHKKVALGVLFINLIWLLPLALLAEIYLEYAVYIAFFGIVPLFLLAHVLGAGRCQSDLKPI
jgi:Fuc2NAc and GlcNAc transferase